MSQLHRRGFLGRLLAGAASLLGLGVARAAAPVTPKQSAVVPSAPPRKLHLVYHGIDLGVASDVRVMWQTHRGRDGLTRIEVTCLCQPDDPEEAHGRLQRPGGVLEYFLPGLESGCICGGGNRLGVRPSVLEWAPVGDSTKLHLLRWACELGFPLWVAVADDAPRELEYHHEFRRDDQGFGKRVIAGRVVFPHSAAARIAAVADRFWEHAYTNTPGIPGFFRETSHSLARCSGEFAYTITDTEARPRSVAGPNP